MKYEEILDILAPCGSNCRKCIFNSNGEIQMHGRKLIELLGSFDNYAKRFSKFLPVFHNYQQFKELLELIVHAECNGCRNQTCSIYPNCGVIDCYKTKGIDFCFECDEFPCEKTNFDPDLRRRWIQMNSRLKEIGIEAYCNESMEIPRYK